jgi:hypothetical protein
VTQLLTTPRAVLLGFSLVASALYFSVRSREPAREEPRVEEPTSPAGAGSIVSSAPVAAPPASNEPTAQAGSTARPTTQALERQVLAALERRRDSLMTACKPTRSLTYSISLLVGADGSQLSRGITVPREERTDVAPCLQSELPPFKVDPPGDPSRLRVQFRFP